MRPSFPRWIAVRKFGGISSRPLPLSHSKGQWSSYPLSTDAPGSAVESAISPFRTSSPGSPEPEP